MEKPPEPVPRPRANRACVICHKKKVKCDLDTIGGSRCTACARDGYECRPRERKRRRTYTLSESPPPSRPVKKREPQSSISNGLILQQPETKYAPVETPRPISGATSVDNGYEKYHNVQPYMTFHAPTESEPSNASPTAVSGSTRSVAKEPPTNISYLGRGEYISNDVEIDEEDAPPEVARVVSERDMEVLQIQRCFEVPPRAIRESLLDSFWKFCWPWTPIVERSWVEGRQPNETSTLLLQAMMLAGSRVTSSPLNSGNPEDFYKKGKTLFWMASEKDPIVNTVAACLLNWWNPEGPEHVSIDTSGFWLRICVSLAYQIGLHREPAKKSDAALRRRLWWSLVNRDSLINAGHGRPRAINLHLSDVLPTTVHDFDGNQHAADLFAAYTGISCIMGDLTQCFLQKGKFTERRASLGDRLFRWVKTLPDALQLCYLQPDRPLKPYSFEARQLHIQYFTALTIINKNPEKGSAPSTASLLASSFVAGLFEDFLARDELRFLGPIFTFYLLCSGTTLLSSYRYPGLWHLAEQDLQIIFKSQEELAKRWPTAVGSLKNLADVREKVTKGKRGSSFPENNLTAEQIQFFDSFGSELCRSWDVLYHGTNNAQQPQTRDLMTAGILQDLRTPGSLYPEMSSENDLAGIHSGMNGLPNPSLDASILDTAGVGNLDTYGGIGNWLFNDWGNTGTLW